MNLGWNWTGNPRPFLVELGRLIGYGFDDSDWIAVEYRIQGTGSEAAPMAPQRPDVTAITGWTSWLRR